MSACVVVPISAETLSKIESNLKNSPGAEVGPATWRDFMPEAKPMASPRVGSDSLGVECWIGVDEHFQGGYIWSANIRPGERPDEDGPFKDPVEALVAGVKHLLSVDDYGDLEEVAYMIDDHPGNQEIGA